MTERIPNMMDADRLIGLYDFLSSRVRGQDRALRIIANAVQRAELGLASPDRPMASFLCLGPTGVGKTETILALSEFLYGTASAVARFDMAEYQDRNAIVRLLGDREEQGILGREIDRRPEGGILLFDEIEKADQGLSTVFLSVLDAGRVTMGTGETKGVTSFYVAFTSNLGSADAIKMQRLPQTTVERRVLAAATDYFRPELLARFQEKLVFNRLSYEVQEEVAEGMLTRALAGIKRSHGLRISFDRKVIVALMSMGYTKELGARPMRSTVEREVGDAVRRYILSNGDPSAAVELYISDGQFELRPDITVT